MNIAMLFADSVQDSTYDVRYHIKDFLASGVVGQSAVGKLCSCHNECSSLVVVSVYHIKPQISITIL